MNGQSRGFNPYIATGGTFTTQVNLFSDASKPFRKFLIGFMMFFQGMPGLQKCAKKQNAFSQSGRRFPYFVTETMYSWIFNWCLLILLYFEFENKEVLSMMIQNAATLY